MSTVLKLSFCNSCDRILEEIEAILNLQEQNFRDPDNKDIKETMMGQATQILENAHFSPDCPNCQKLKKLLQDLVRVAQKIT